MLRILARRLAVSASFHSNLLAKLADSAAGAFIRGEKRRICRFSLILRAHLSRWPRLAEKNEAG
jgi:hypothetical protein